MAITRGSQLLLEREDVRDISKCIFEAAERSDGDAQETIYNCLQASFVRLAGLVA